MPQSNFRLALAQSPGELSGVTARLEWLRQTLATLPPADLLLLPELFACGYNIPDHIAAWAEPANGPIFQAVADLAQAHGTAILYGFAEAADGVIYNSAQCVGPDGALLHRHRKLAIPRGFERDHYTPGRGAYTFRYRDLTIGVLVCYDVEFPETVRHLAKRGAQLVLVPTALGSDWSWVTETAAPARAFENGLYLAYANHAGVENALGYAGRSVIAAPDGREAARAGGAPCVITAEIDLDRIAAARADIDYLADVGGIALE